jgi:SAM-dependent methyltransferase
MTDQILHWIASVLPHLQPGRVLEVGSRNVNGSPRPMIEPAAKSYVGTDMQDGEGVDWKLHNTELQRTFGMHAFDTILCCECLEHDSNFLLTVEDMRSMLDHGGMLLITTPTFGFPLHRYPKDYWRFGEDTYRDVFFMGLQIVDLQLLSSNHGKDTTIAGLARKP